MRVAWHFYKLHFPIFFTEKYELLNIKQKIKKAEKSRNESERKTTSNIVSNNAAAWLQLHSYPLAGRLPPSLSCSLPLSSSPYSCVELCASRLPCVLWGFIVAFWLSRRRQATTTAENGPERQTQAQRRIRGRGEWNKQKKKQATWLWNRKQLILIFRLFVISSFPTHSSEHLWGYAPTCAIGTCILVCVHVCVSLHMRSGNICMTGKYSLNWETNL